LWKCLPSVTDVTASLFIENNIHITDILLGKIDVKEIAALKYPSGALIGKRAHKIVKVSDIDDENNYKVYKNLISAIPGISSGSASKILT